MNIPKHNATLEEVIDFYRNSDVYRRLSSSSQKDYDNHLSATLTTEVEGKMLRAYRCKNLKVRHITQAYEQWLQLVHVLPTTDAVSFLLRGNMPCDMMCSFTIQ